jgi:hypothetical protein
MLRQLYNDRQFDFMCICQYMVMDGIYSVGRLAPWEDIIEYLSKKGYIEPKYILGTEKRINPDCRTDSWIHTSKYNINRGLLTEEFDIESINLLDAATAEKYSEYENIALRTMDRMDMYDSFGYERRYRLYTKLLSYYIQIYKYTNPDVAIFELPPHIPASYILYSVCMENDVEVVIFTHTPINNLCYTRESILDSSKRLIREYEESKQKDIKPELDQESIEYLDKIKSDYTDAEPAYMKNQRIVGSAHTDWPKLAELKNTISNFESGVVSILKGAKKVYSNRDRMKETTYLVDSNRRPEDGIYRNQIKLYNLRSNFYKSRLRATYEEKSVNPNLNKKYIYFPLHYQPEQTTVPEGGRYADQYLITKMISENISEDWEIYVKEHPSQFARSLRGEQGRSNLDYDQFRNINNVKLIDLYSNPFALIENSEIVATVTGTAGWEAVARGTPAMVFGNPWYQACRGVMRVHTPEDIRNSIEVVENNSIIDETEIYKFVHSIEKVGYQLPQSPDKADNFDKVKSNYCKMIIEQINR